jgi:hypothetical protein
VDARRRRETRKIARKHIDVESKSNANLSAQRIAGRCTSWHARSINRSITTLRVSKRTLLVFFFPALCSLSIGNYNSRTCALQVDHADHSANVHVDVSVFVDCDRRGGARRVGGEKNRSKKKHKISILELRNADEQTKRKTRDNDRTRCENDATALVYAPGHGLTLHGTLSLSAGHVELPPVAIKIVRCRVSVPPPHGAEHNAAVDHSLTLQPAVAVPTSTSVWRSVARGRPGCGRTSHTALLTTLLASSVEQLATFVSVRYARASLICRLTPVPLTRSRTHDSCASPPTRYSSTPLVSLYASKLPTSWYACQKRHATPTKRQRRKKNIYIKTTTKG